MHPAVKIVSLVILSMFSTQGEWYTLLLTGVIILPFYIVQPYLWQSAFRMLFRLKWLFFSILLIYFFFSPTLPIEHPLAPDSGYLVQLQKLSAYMNQMLPGIFRITVLILIIFSVNLFLKTTTKEQILAALLWLFYPLKFLNINIERILLRAVLTLEYIEVLTLRLAEYKLIKSDNPNNIPLAGQTFKQKLIHTFIQKRLAFFHLVEHSGTIVHEILDEAEKTSGKIVTVVCLDPPLASQFMIPVILCLLFILTLSI